MRIIIFFLLLGTSVLAQITTPKIGQFPSLRVQPTVGARERNLQDGSEFRKTMQITPKLVVEGGSKMLPIPAAEATMVVVSMDTRAKYVEGKEVYKVTSAQTMSLPAARNGDRREFTFAETSLTFDGDRDSSNLGGEVYKFFICGIRDPATRTLILFHTPNSQLDNFCKTHPDKRDEFLQMQKGSIFPAAFK